MTTNLNVTTRYNQATERRQALIKRASEAAPEPKDLVDWAEAQSFGFGLSPCHDDELWVRQREPQPIWAERYPWDE